MSLLFSNPSILWALLALPALAVLLMVLPRTRKIRVSSLQFWTDADAEARVQQARRMRRLNMASALLLVVLGLLIITLAGPEVVGNESGAAALAIVVDRSPVLAAPVGGEGTPSRAELIDRRLDEFLSGLPHDMILEMQFVPVASAGADKDDVGGRYRGNVRQVRRWLQEEYRLTDAGVDWQQLRQAAIAARDRLEAPVLLVTDVLPHEDKTGGLIVPAGVWLLTSGGNSRNAALTSAAVQQRRDGLWGMIEYAACGRWDEGDQADILLKVVPGDESGEAVAAAGAEFQSPVDFSSAAGAMTFKLPALAAQADTLRLLLDVEDDWPADNELRLRRVEVRQPKVAYVGRADENLLHLLAVAGAEVVRWEADVDAGTSDGAMELPANADVTFFVDRAPPAGFRGAAIVVNPPGRIGPVSPGEFENSVARLEAVPSRLKAILPDEVARVRRWRSAQAGPGVEPLLADKLTGRPVALRYESAGGRAVVVVLADISAESTDWAERVGFPVFWRAMLDETMPATTAHRLEFVVDALRQRPLLTERCAGAAIDETAAAHKAALEARRESRPTLTSLWPHVLLAALAALGVRLWLMR